MAGGIATRSHATAPCIEQKQVMDEDLIDPELLRLVAAHPTLFDGVPPRAFSYLPAGWYTTVDCLCTELEEELGEDAYRHLRIAQLKEKFGTLRIYYRFAADEADSDDKSADGRFVVSVANQQTEAQRARVRALVDAAQRQSETTCLRCGAAGALRDVDGYLATLCDHHYQAAISRKDRPDAER